MWGCGGVWRCVGGGLRTHLYLSPPLSLNLSLRAQFSGPALNEEETPAINAVHGSSSLEEAQHDLNFFFPVEKTLAVIKPTAMASRGEGKGGKGGRKGECDTTVFKSDRWRRSYVACIMKENVSDGGRRDNEEV